MKSISFKNFRRFADFPEFKFGDITILVGGNNAGKSTLVKALILLIDNLRELKLRNGESGNSLWPVFSFDMDHIHQLNLGTYERVHKIGSEESIYMQAEIGNYDISFLIEPTSDSEIKSPQVTIVEVTIIDNKRQIVYSVSPQYMSLRIMGEKTSYTFIPPAIKDEIAKLEDIASKSENIQEIAAINEVLDKYRGIIDNYVSSQNTDESESGEVVAPTSNYIDLIKDSDYTIPTNHLAQMIYQWIAYQISKPGLNTYDGMDIEDDSDSEEEQSFETLEDLISNGLDSKVECVLADINGHFNREAHEANHMFLEDKMSLLRESAKELDKTLLRLNTQDEVFYIQVHGVSQRVIYNIDNRNDYMGSILHNFSRENVQKGTEPDRFLKRWLNAFEIGIDYRVSSIEGEGYTLEIETKKGTWQHLADLGMGSNQIVTLLIELATIIKGKNPKEHPFIIIEEPEQNLHPRIQSKLARLFSELNNDRGFKFLIETHSEYLIRYTQVLVAEMNLNNTELEKQNPFKVYYFPEEGVPYDMRYLPSGRFENKFGNGFFDESAKWHLEILKKEKERK